jgi:hypothetical protein
MPTGRKINKTIKCTMRMLNRKTATGAYMHHRFLRASFKLNNFSKFCPFVMFDKSKCSLVFNLTSGIRVRATGCCTGDVRRVYGRSRDSIAFLHWSSVRKLGKSCVLLGFFFLFEIINHGSQRGNTVRALTQWWYLVALHEATDALHRAMRPASHHRIRMAFEIASVRCVFFCHHQFCS